MMVKRKDRADLGDLPLNLLEKVPRTLARIYGVIPIGYDEQGRLMLASRYGQMGKRLQDLHFLEIDCSIGRRLNRKDMTRALNRYYPVLDKDKKIPQTTLVGREEDGFVDQPDNTRYG